MLWGCMSSQPLEARRIGGQSWFREREREQMVRCQAAQHQLQIGRRAFAEHRAPHRLCCRCRSGLAQESGLEVLQGLPERYDAIARGAPAVARGALAKPWWGDGGWGDRAARRVKGSWQVPQQTQSTRTCAWVKWPDVEDQDLDVCTPANV